MTTEHKPQKPTIEFAHLETLDIRMCRIEAAIPVLKNPKKELAEDNPVKAYELLIDTGLDKRSCITNLIELKPEQLVGAVCPFILNLPTATIRGVQSSAMIVAAGRGKLLETVGATPGDVVL